MRPGGEDAVEAVQQADAREREGPHAAPTDAAAPQLASPGPGLHGDEAHDDAGHEALDDREPGRHGSTHGATIGRPTVLHEVIRPSVTIM
jgi:hypothetical protein